MSNPKFLIHRASDGQLYFNWIAINGEVVLTSERYTSRTGVDNGIASVRENAAHFSGPARGTRRGPLENRASRLRGGRRTQRAWRTSYDSNAIDDVRHSTRIEPRHLGSTLRRTCASRRSSGRRACSRRYSRSFRRGRSADDASLNPLPD
jgi:uncharacterized protein YegP (UPF0339 family)